MGSSPHLLLASYDEVPSFKGASSHILANVRALMSSYSVTLLSLGENQLPSYSGFKHKNLVFKEQNYLRRAFLFSNAVDHEIKQIKYDLGYVRSPFEALAFIRNKIPYVYEVNALPSLELPFHFPNLNPSVLNRIREQEILSLKKADEILTPSLRTYRLLTEEIKIPSDKVHLNPNGFDLIDKEKKSLPWENCILKGVYIGALQEWQGIHWALKSFKGFKDKINLTIFPSAERRGYAELIKYCERYELQDVVRVEHPHNKNDLSNRLKEFHFGFAPLLKVSRNTDQGCSPMKILDYMNHGLPTLCSDLFVTKAFVADGLNGWRFEAGQRKALDQSFERIWEDRKKIGWMQKQCEQMLRLFPTWAENGNKVCEVVESCLVKK